MRHFYLCFALATSLLGAGEYSVFSPGFEFSISKGMASHQNLSNKADKGTKCIDACNDVDKLVGIGMTSQIRLDEFLSGAFSGIAMVPTIGLKFGTSSKSTYSANMAYTYDDNHNEEVSDATSSIKTKMYEFTLSVPFRWYFMTKNTAYGGAFVEFGPLVRRTKHKNSLQVVGTTLLQSSFTGPKKLSCTNNTNYGLMVGIGTTSIYDEHQFTYGLSLHAMSTKSKKDKSKQQPQSEVNLHIAWTF
jgi:hypothetical protein